jgi:hypothetical protein
MRDEDGAEEAGQKAKVKTAEANGTLGRKRSRDARAGAKSKGRGQEPEVKTGDVER